MARSFLNPTTAAAVKAAAPKLNDEQFKDRIALGMAIGGCYRASMSRADTVNALINGPAHLTSDEAEAGVARWETNQKLYGKIVVWEA
jgi:hypothetical protein